GLPPLATRELLPAAGYHFAPPGGIADSDLARATAVRVRLQIFDSNGEAPFAGKRILLNGRDVAGVPASPANRFHDWHEVILELTPEQAGAIGRTNTIEITNAGGDMWKLRGVALAVRHPAGHWVASRPDPRSFSAGGEGWLYHEGESWRDKTPPIRLELPGPGSDGIGQRER
ncbi:MAG: hypothetical protein HUU35_18595, partial [Armatimonadetes bacterium]|nr:hypothetical protein [Armatimonadota bacterium]